MRRAQETGVAESTAAEPRVIDTYSVSYALMVLLLLPGVAMMSRLPFGDARSTTYTFEYVSLVTLPFVFGTALTFMLSSPEGVKRGLLRVAVLTPLVVLTGVTFMFGFSMVMIPASRFLGIKEQGLSVAWWAGLGIVAAPLVATLVRKLRNARGMGAAGVVEVVAVSLVVALVAALTVFSFFVDANIYELWRKDVVIYVVGALTWYAPSFGLAAGFWRRTGLV